MGNLWHDRSAFTVAHTTNKMILINEDFFSLHIALLLQVGWSSGLTNFWLLMNWNGYLTSSNRYPSVTDRFFFFCVWEKVNRNIFSFALQDFFPTSVYRYMPTSYSPCNGVVYVMSSASFISSPVSFCKLKIFLKLFFLRSFFFICNSWHFSYRDLCLCVFISVNKVWGCFLMGGRQFCC